MEKKIVEKKITPQIGISENEIIVSLGESYEVCGMWYVEIIVTSILVDRVPGKSNEDLLAWGEKLTGNMLSKGGVIRGF